MTRIALILLSALYAAQGLAETNTSGIPCVTAVILGHYANEAACTAARTQASRTQAPGTSPATAIPASNVVRCQAMIPECGWVSPYDPNQAGNWGNLYSLMVLYQLGILPKEYLTYALYQQYPQLYWLAYLYGDQAVDYFLQAYQLQYFQQYSPYYDPAVSQQLAFYSFLRNSFTRSPVPVPLSASTPAP